MQFYQTIAQSSLCPVVMVICSRGSAMKARLRDRGILLHGEGGIDRVGVDRRSYRNALVNVERLIALPRSVLVTACCMARNGL